jgi:hypothetical protein
MATSEASHRLQAERHEKGICTQCGLLETDGTWRCELCRDVINRNRRRRRGGSDVEAIYRCGCCDELGHRRDKCVQSELTDEL